MKKNLIKVFSVAAMIAVVFTGCKKDDDDTPAVVSEPGTAKIEFENVVGSTALTLNTGNYSNDMAQPFNVTKFKYYVSNLKFYKSDGSSYSVPESYYLVDAAASGSNELSIPNIPAGEYTSLEFVIGVDSARNFSGAQTGALDPANGMFWTWNSGYIFVMFEGTSSAAAMNDLTFHIGGCTGVTNCIRKTTINFGGEKLIVEKKLAPELHLKTNILEMFKSPATVDFSTLSMTMGGPDAVKVADNYVDMFKFDHIHP